MPNRIEGAGTLREKLIKIGAKVVKHSRYVVFQMAEVVVPRMLFREILDQISQLRAGPELTRAGWPAT
ncbi:MAG: transposase [Phycisphaerales bacterium]|nr:MAG: transposase [Phycisphaerales bacterium]